MTFQLVKHCTIFASMDKFKMILKLDNRAQVLYTYWTQEAFTNFNSSHIDYLHLQLLILTVWRIAAELYFFLTEYKYK